MWLLVLSRLRLPPGIPDLAGMLLLAAMTTAGVALLREQRAGAVAPPRRCSVGRAGGVAFFSVIAFATAYQLVTQIWLGARAAPHWTLQVGLGLANASCATLLIVWGCFRASAVLLRRDGPRVCRPALGTRVMLGLALCVAAAAHLALWRGAAAAPGGSLTLEVGAGGIVFFGFPGWPYWHLALLLLGLVLIGGSQRLARYAAFGVALLALLSLILVGTAAFSVSTEFLRWWTWLALLLPPIALALFCWWLAAELGAPATSTSSGPGGDSGQGD